MESDDKTVVYAIIAACVLGIAIIGAFVITSDTSGGFSELYFEDHTELPRMVEMDEDVSFAFTVVSHEKDETTYEYDVTYDNWPVKSGSFTLLPEDSVLAGEVPAKGNEKTINASIVPRESSLVRVDEPRVHVSRLRYDGKLGMVTGQGDGFERLNIVTSPNGYSVVYWGANNTTHQIDVTVPDKLIFPVMLPVSGVPDHTGMLIFDPSAKEAFSTNSSSLKRVGDPYSINPAELNTLSNYGYTLRREEWEIENNYGNLDILRRYEDTDYRYEFRKVSVEVSSLESEICGLNETIMGTQSVFGEAPVLYEYEIHFWIIVKEDPERLVGL